MTISNDNHRLTFSPYITKIASFFQDNVEDILAQLAFKDLQTFFFLPSNKTVNASTVISDNHCLLDYAARNKCCLKNILL